MHPSMGEGSNNRAATRNLNDDPASWDNAASSSNASPDELRLERTMLELLNQLDGFDTHGNVKVIMATNRIDSLNPALIRSGQIDHKIEFHYRENKTTYLQVCNLYFFN